MNDLANVYDSILSVHFAYDRNVFDHGHDLYLIKHCLNKELARISNWIKVNKLSLNIKNTLCDFYRKKLQKKINLCIDNQPMY